MQKYSGEQNRAVAMPIGGIGTGTIAVAGDGSLRQWQIHNQANHQACVPHSFFSIRAGGVSRVLQSGEHYASTPHPPAPATSSDWIVPIPHQRLLKKLPGVDSTSFTGTYPFAQVQYHDAALPVSVELTAWNPMIPFDAESSGIPAISFALTVRNHGSSSVSGDLAASMQNAVGWDGVAAIFDNACDLYGGNVNAPYSSANGHGVRMSNPFLPANSEHNGEMLLTTTDSHTRIVTQWSDLAQHWYALDSKVTETAESDPSPKGKTWNCAVAVPFELQPGEETTIQFQLAWHFPNRYVNYPQHEFLGVQDRKSKFWIGNAYATRWHDVAKVAEHMWSHHDELLRRTRALSDAFTGSSLPESVVSTVTSQMSVMRTPTCFRGEDGNLYGFEGCSGFSTAHHTKGYEGCCPLNCTHVWNYEQSLSFLYPELAKTMRDTEWQLQQHPSGYLPHRVTLPRDLPRMWERTIGGPDKPALDGLLGAILKTWREYRNLGDKAWLSECWPSIELALQYIRKHHDPEQAGVIEGEQPNTYDISIFGLNTFIGALYIAALDAASEIVKELGHAERASTLAAMARSGSQRLDDRLWNGEYYIQDVDLAQHAEQNWATGCHIDHLLGQWWAEVLQLPDTLDPQRLDTAVGSIYQHNFRPSLHGTPKPERWFADPDDAGMINCTWPNGGRPEVPTRYSDEVWTGLEYEVAALLLYRGHVQQAISVLEAVRARYDGQRMNPWNDIECGDHYVRAMSSWSLLTAATRFGWRSHAKELVLGNGIGAAEITAPFFAGTGWGTFSLNTESCVIHVIDGRFPLQRLVLQGVSADSARISVGEHELTANISASSQGLVIRLASPIELASGERLEIALD